MNLRHIKGMQALRARINCSFTTMFFKLCNYLIPQQSCWVCRGKFSIDLLVQNKQTKSALRFPVNTAQDSARSELSSTFKSAAAMLLPHRLKNKKVFVGLRSLWYTAQQPVAIVTSKVTQKKFWLFKAVLVKSAFYSVGVCSSSAFIHCWPHSSIHSPASRQKGLQELTLKQIKNGDVRKLSQA